MLNKIFATMLCIICILISTGCSTTGYSTTNYVTHGEEVYVPIKNGEKVVVYHNDISTQTQEEYTKYQICISGNKYTQVDLTENIEYTHTFDSNIVEIRLRWCTIVDGPEYAYRTLKNEVGVICKDRVRVFKKGDDNIERALFYKNEQNNVDVIKEWMDSLILYEDGKLIGAGLAGNSVYFDDLPYVVNPIYDVKALSVGKGNSDCGFYAYCPNSEEGDPIEKLIADSGISY